MNIVLTIPSLSAKTPAALSSPVASTPAAVVTGPAAADVQAFRDALSADLNPKHRAYLPSGNVASVSKVSQNDRFPDQALAFLARPAQQRVELHASMSQAATDLTDLTPVDMFRSARQMADYTTGTMLVTKTIAQSTQTIKQLLTSQ